MLRSVIVWLVGLLLASGTAAAAELVMFETAGCPWCVAWERRIGPIYPKTPEGKAAPLRKVEVREPRPADLVSVGEVTVTPTFVLVHEGREVGRIVGYNDEAFFWGFLGELIAKLPKPPAG